MHIYLILRAFFAYSAALAQHVQYEGRLPVAVESSDTVLCLERLAGELLRFRDHRVDVYEPMERSYRGGLWVQVSFRVRLFPHSEHWNVRRVRFRVGALMPLTRGRGVRCELDLRDPSDLDGVVRILSK